MPTSRLEVGEFGTIKVKDVTPPGQKGKLWRAQCRVRDIDGEVRQVSRTGTSQTAATAALKKALRQRKRRSDDDELGPESLVRDAAQRWFAGRREATAAGDFSTESLRLYEGAWRLHIDPTLGALRLREATTARCEAWQDTLLRRKGPDTVRTARAVLSNVLGYAARMGAIDTNPCRDLSRIPGARKRKPRSMDREQRRAFLAAMEANPRAAAWSIPDLVRFLLATGVRIGEALAVSWDEVDLDAGTVKICWHILRVRGKGLHRVPGAKSEAGDRVLRLPRWAVDMLMRRRVDPMSGYPVFPDSLGGWRDPSNTQRVFRETRDAAGFGWVTSRVFRQTVITVLDGAGLPTREVADHVGHSKIDMTHRYMARGVASDRAAEALEDLL